MTGEANTHGLESTQPIERTKALPMLGTGRGYRFAVAGALAATLLATGVWAAKQQPDPADRGWTPAPAAAAQPACKVVYRVISDDGRSFDVDLTVHNGSDVPVDDWRLEFALSGDQEIRADDRLWQQEGHNVVLSSADGLPANGSAKFELTGSYAKLNALPTDFRLAGQDCTATVIGGHD